MCLCQYVFGAFLPSVPGWCRHADPLIKTAPVGKGTRFLRLRNMTVYVRDDSVVYGDILPFRSVGGKGAAVNISSKSAAENDVILSAAWDDATQTSGSDTVLQQAVEDPVSIASPASQIAGRNLNNLTPQSTRSATLRPPERKTYTLPNPKNCLRALTMRIQQR